MVDATAAKPTVVKPTVAKSTAAPSGVDTNTVVGSTVVGTGKTTIDEGVISKVAGIATRNVPGVFAVGSGVSRAIGAIRDAMNQTDRSQGVTIEVGESQVAVDITIVAEYPTSLQKVADDVRVAVYTAIEEIVGMEVTEVNVTINDVHIPGEDETTDEVATKTARVL
jgi:uncharacterized alkaline shock family protein YloU